MRFELVMATVGGFAVFGMDVDMTNAHYYSIDCGSRRCREYAPRHLRELMMAGGRCD
jgi:hypothetical protein